jgi:glycosyltransferase involved in cell wall biosynthesis
MPSYNTGELIYRTVCRARAFWAPVWVVIDGSTDGTLAGLQAIAGGDPALRVLNLPANAGKGAAVLHGARAAAEAGFTHVLMMDADGQHPADAIPRFMAASQADPDALITGIPVFGPEAPRLRVWGRKISNFWADLETSKAGIGDSLFGFRVYPIGPLLAVMAATRWARRFDFDPEVAVRLCWHGVRPIALPAAVRYIPRAEGGVSHFHYLRDNLLLAGMHARLLWAWFSGRGGGLAHRPD